MDASCSLGKTSKIHLSMDFLPENHSYFIPGMHSIGQREFLAGEAESPPLDKELYYRDTKSVILADKQY
jgi:hypothetical protein